MKIEEGCFAIIVTEDNDPDMGKIVRVGKFIGEAHLNGYISKNKDLWEVDQPMIMVCSAENKFLGMQYIQSEKYLRRIDDPNGEEIEKQSIDFELN